MTTLFSPPLDALARPARGARLGVLASGSGSNFEAIVDAIAAGALNAEVACVIYNNPGAGVIERAERLGVEAVLVDHRVFDDREAFDAAVVAELRARDVEWVVMAGWMRISTATLIEAFSDRIVNVHPSLLPAFRGYDAVGQALAAGVKFMGCTVHIVRLAVDDGPIIAQAVLPLNDEPREALMRRLHAAEHALFPRAIGHAIAMAEEE